MRAVVDTNCLLASIPPKGQGYWLYEAFIAKKFTWVVSTEILLEYYEMITLRFSKETADLVIEIMLSKSNTELAEPSFIWNLIEADPDDNKFANLALSVGATLLVSNDKHFDIFNAIDFPPLNVVKLNEFKEILTGVF